MTLQHRPEAAVPGPETHPGWLASACDPAAFRAEQAKLRHVWTFLGLASDAPRDGDWLRASLADRSVFVQREDGVLRGFENRCAHRGYPIRTRDRGQGPIVCGLHQWRYDREGRATGIPLSRPLFGASPGELGAHLEPLEVAVCGDFVFGRFAPGRPGEPLEAWLGPAAPILETLSAGSRRHWAWSREIACNWRFFSQLTLDDYHLAAIHPDSLGKHGYLKPQFVHYERFGAHSVYCFSQQDWSLEAMSRGCADGSWISADYTTIQLFPHLTVVHMSWDTIFRSVLTMQLTPLGFDRTRLTVRLHPLGYRSARAWHRFRRRWGTELTQFFVWRSSLKIMGQDIGAAEALQTTAAQMDEAPRWGGFERRIGWFEETYRAMVEDG